MAEQITVLKVFIASPSDVQEERDIIDSIVTEFNRTWADKQKIRLETIKWETHSWPSFGDNPQEVINKQINDEYDIFLGIMWGRFGTPTNKSDSGTEEEFKRAYTRLTSNENIKILFYFKDSGIPLSQIDTNQINKIQDFKKTISKEFGGLYFQFETLDEFQTLVRVHLAKIVQELQTENLNKQIETTLELEHESNDEFNPLANLASIEEEYDELGYIELVEQGSSAMLEVNTIVNNMTNSTLELGRKFEIRTEQATKATNKNDFKAIHKVADDTADDLEIFVSEMSIEIPKFYKQNSIFNDSFSKLALITTYEELDVDDIKQSLKEIINYRKAIDTSSLQLINFRTVLSNLPKLNARFNRSQRRAVAIMDDLLIQLKTTSNQILTIENFIIEKASK